jgi:hypothetical protein
MEVYAHRLSASVPLRCVDTDFETIFDDLVFGLYGRVWGWKGIFRDQKTANSGKPLLACFDGAME